MTRYPKKGEALIFSEYQRPRIITFKSPHSTYEFMGDGGPITLKQSWYVYNNIGYSILGKFDVAPDNRNRIIEHLIDRVWTKP